MEQKKSRCSGTDLGNARAKTRSFRSTASLEWGLLSLLVALVGCQSFESVDSEIGLGRVSESSEAQEFVRDVDCYNSIAPPVYNESTSPSLNSVVDDNAATIVSLAGAHQRVCALLSNAEVKCWGLGDRTGRDIRVGHNEETWAVGAEFVDAQSVSIGFHHSCAVERSGDVYCRKMLHKAPHDNDWQGTLGRGYVEGVSGYARLGGKAESVFSNNSRNCAIMETGSLRCWGRAPELTYYNRNRFGNIIGDDEEPSVDADLAFSARPVKLALHNDSTCALLETGVVECAVSPDAISLFETGGIPVLDIAGYFDGGGTCLLRADGKVQCGVPGAFNVKDLGGAATSIFVGLQHGCAVMETGALRCWGDNTHGQLGYTVPSVEDPGLAGDVPLDGVVVSGAATASTTCVLLASDQVKCWGLNREDQTLGLGTRHFSGAAPNDVPPVPVRFRDVVDYRLHHSEGPQLACLLSSAVQLENRDVQGALDYALDRIRQQLGTSDAALEQLGAQDLETTLARSVEIDQEIIVALDQVISTAYRVPCQVNYWPQHDRAVSLVVDILTGLADRLEAQSAIQDVANLLLHDARTVASDESRRLWTFLANLLNREARVPPFAAGDIGGWKRVAELRKLLISPSRVWGGRHMLLDEWLDLPAFCLKHEHQEYEYELWLLMNRAREKLASLDATGAYDGTASKSLKVPLHNGVQEDVVGLAQYELNDLQHKLTTYATNFRTQVGDFLAKSDRERSLAEVNNELERRSREYKEEADELAYLATLHANEDEASASIIADTFEQVRDTLGANQFAVETSLSPFGISGADAKFLRHHRLSDWRSWAAWTLEKVQPGRVVHLNIEGSYAPTCRIGQSIVSNDIPASKCIEVYCALRDSPEFSLMVSPEQAETSSRGYYATMTNQGAELRSVGLERSRTESWGGGEWRQSRGDSMRWQYGVSEALSRTMGLRLDNTPFPEAPVGSLVLIHADPNGFGPGQSKIIKVEPLRNGSNLILTEHASEIDLHIVVNDLDDPTNCQPQQSPSLTLSGKVLKNTSETAQTVISQMKSVLSNLRSQTDEAYLGASLPSAVNNLVGDAKRALEVAISPNRLSDYPALERLFSGFVLREAVARERLARMRALRHSMESVENQMDLLQQQRHELEQQGFAIGAARRYLRRLDWGPIRYQTERWAQTFTEYVYPLLAVRYQGVLERIRNDPSYYDVRQKLEALATVSPYTSAYNQAQDFTEVLSTVVNAMPWQRISDNYGTALVAVTLGSGPQAGSQAWPAADADTQSVVWKALEEGTSATFTLKPDGLFARSSSEYQLFCDWSAPVIRQMSLAAVAPQPFVQPTLRIVAETDTYQRFVHPTAGFATFEVSEDARALKKDRPFLYVGTETEVVNAFRNDSATDPNVFGMSPFSTMTLDLSGVRNKINPNFLPGTSLVLLMHVDYKVEAQNMTWLPGCN